MAKKRRKPAPKALITEGSLRNDYNRAVRMAESGRWPEAAGLYRTLAKVTEDNQLQALIRNDLAALDFLNGDQEAAHRGFTSALVLDPDCKPAQSNLEFLAENPRPNPLPEGDGASSPAMRHSPRATRVAILSFLFNWPTTGGGNVHTYELAIFLERAGFEVKHYYVRFVPWGIGNVPRPLPYPCEALEFTESEWSAATIQSRFRQCVERFSPDYVIVSDSWNMKPLLAEAIQSFPYFMRLQAMECLCPLNNVRLLFDGQGGVAQCHRHQLATPQECLQCLAERGQWSGALHQVERALAGVGTQQYYDLLMRSMRDAEAVLVVNPYQQVMVEPYARRVEVVTAGMDPTRFPWPNQESCGPPWKILFAGLASEPMKGFAVLREACNRLWQRRQDFRLVVTDDPQGPLEPFAEYIGWQSQDDLPSHMQESAICVVPTVAQEALGRTAVEAMAAGRPVVASRLGGLNFTVVDGSTGLLCEPGNPEDLAAKLESLLDDQDRRKSLGLAGRKRFEEHYAWPVIIERHYRPVLSRKARSR
jgi:glycosyltransferase involved in cell wall biosynthesis